MEEPNAFCGQFLVPQMNNAWENLNKMWKERLEKLEEAMQSAVQYQDTLQVRGRAGCVVCESSPWSCTEVCTHAEQRTSRQVFAASGRA